jgi:selenoprotein W-related protein
MGKPHPISELTLIPSGGGCFEVIADGELIYSKKATGQHTTNEAMIAAFQERFDLV